MATKAARRARRDRRRLADLTRTEAALATTCPRCKTAPGIWCGPVLTHAVLRPITPWMHEQRYITTSKES
jgi:hypothetical protein